MTTSPMRDMLVGLFVVAALSAIAYLSVPIGGLRASPDSATFYASFDEIGQLRDRAAVVVGGVRVGQVEAIGLDEDYRARIRISVDPALPLPEDTSASILTAGILGNQYIALEPGGSDVMLEPGSDIAYTQSAFVIERVIGRLVQNLGGGS